MSTPLIGHVSTANTFGMGGTSGGGLGMGLGGGTGGMGLRMGGGLGGGLGGMLNTLPYCICTCMLIVVPLHVCLGNAAMNAGTPAPFVVSEISYYLFSY